MTIERKGLIINEDLRGATRALAAEIRRNRKAAETEHIATWTYPNSSIDSFACEFAYTIKKSFATEIKDRTVTEAAVAVFKEDIENTLSFNREQNGTLTAVELGGPGSNLFSAFPGGFFEATAGVCLKDFRNDVTQTSDEQSHHHVIEGDVFDREIYHKICEILSVPKVDLIISRMLGPLRSMTRHPILWERMIKTWYSILNENGLMFVQFQFPKQNFVTKKDRDIIEKGRRLVKQWAESIQEKSGGTIEISVDYDAFRLHKKSGAPEQLPLYDHLR